MSKTIIKVAYELTGIKNVVIDTNSKMWRLPYFNAQGKRYKLREIKPFFERNYTAYQIFGKVYSLRQIVLIRRAKTYTMVINGGEVIELRPD